MVSIAHRPIGRRALIAVAGLLAAFAAALSLAAAASAEPTGYQWDELLPAPGACGPAESNAYAPAADQMAAAVCLVNAARVKHGEAALGIGPTGLGILPIAAYFKASDIGRCQSADPHTACGRPVDYWLNRYSRWRADCPNGSWAENIYWGSGYLGTAREAVRWWLNSPYGHREMLLDPRYTHHGLNVKRITVPLPGPSGHAGVRPLPVPLTAARRIVPT